MIFNYLGGKREEQTICVAFIQDEKRHIQGMEMTDISALLMGADITGIILDKGEMQDLYELLKLRLEKE